MNISCRWAVDLLALTAAVITIFLLSPSFADAAVDHSIFAEMLNDYVNNGQVNYDGFQQEEKKLDRYLAALEAVEPQDLAPNEQFAYYANAYNAWTIKAILSKYPDIDSIKELGIFNTGPWKKKIVRLNGQMLSLDNIEHDVLRPQFKDPRVHFAINCAAYSCPPLRSEPFVGRRLDAQLDAATRSFINNPDRNYLDGDTLYVSKIFKWFAEDFNHDPVSFVLRYAEGSLKSELQARRASVKVKYLPYDWSLNNRPQ
jgi:hypothetical protein